MQQERYGCFGGAHRSRSRMAEVSRGSGGIGGDGTATFRLPAIVPPHPANVSNCAEITVKPMPPPISQGRPRSGTTVPEHGLPSVERQDSARFVWNSRSTPSANLRTGTRGFHLTQCMQRTQRNGSNGHNF